MWCWRRFLRVPWTARWSYQPILKEISPEYSLEQHAEAEAPILWPPDAKNLLTGKDPDAGKDWREEEKGTTEEVGWYHRLDGHQFEQAPGVGDGQRGLVCCSPRGRTESDTTEQLNWYWCATFRSYHRYLLKDLSFIPPSNLSFPILSLPLKTPYIFTSQDIAQFVIKHS